jgi:ankyrin repeat protein
MQTSLSFAARNRHEIIVQLLLEKGADITTRDNDERTPLSFAAKNGHEAIVQLLELHAV